VPGGGTGHPGALDAPQIVAEAARRIALHSIPTILVGVSPPSASEPAPHGAELRLAPRLPIAMVGELIRAARLVISNGGDTMLQTIACNRPCVAVAIAGDQAHRIRQCVQQGLVVRARLDANDLERIALQALAPDGAGARAAPGMVSNGLDAALDAIAKLAGLAAGPAIPPKQSIVAARATAPPSAPVIHTSAGTAPRLLFLPVSGAHGMGEYVRTLQIAYAAAARWPQAQIHFALSKAAPYEADGAFAATLLPSSPTFHTPEVVALIEQMQPHVVIFDNAGRTAQLHAAQRAGARVIYISARSRQRRKAFRWRWMSLIDEHWVAYPEFLSGPLSAIEKFKLRRMGRPLLRYLDVMLPAPDARTTASILERLELTARAYVLVVPGGGTGHPGAHDAVQTFATAAHDLAARGAATVFVAPPSGYQTRTSAALKTVPRLPLVELAALMRHARLVVANGGSTMLQAIACHAPCVAVSIAKDQAKRVRQCVDAGLVVAASLNAEHIVSAASTLLDHETARAALARRAAALQLADGLSIALAAIESLLGHEVRA
jgi:ADP-heptose:LPS heptosyltransferase